MGSEARGAPAAVRMAMKSRNAAPLEAPLEALLEAPLEAPLEESMSL